MNRRLDSGCLEQIQIAPIPPRLLISGTKWIRGGGYWASERSPSCRTMRRPDAAPAAAEQGTTAAARSGTGPPCIKVFCALCDLSCALFISVSVRSSTVIFPFRRFRFCAGQKPSAFYCFHSSNVSSLVVRFIGEWLNFKKTGSTRLFTFLNL